MPDEDSLYRDDLLERRLERDREREPVKFRPVLRDLAGRHALMIGLAPTDSSIAALACPVCGGPVYAPADSCDERVDCNDCDARLVTRRAIGGEVSVVSAGGVP